MLFMNDFLEKETVNMKQYVDRISVSVPVARHHGTRVHSPGAPCSLLLLQMPLWWSGVPVSST